MLARKTVGVSINRLLFRYANCSIYKKLYDPDNDCLVRSRIELLHKIHMDLTFKKADTSNVGPNFKFDDSMCRSVDKARARRSSVDGDWRASCRLAQQ